ncbi:MAG: hypothetical protein EB027_02300 [Actinobacteria bacterium]|nr:hypothetical protein [Actinomycetota bacterium]
MNSRVARAVVTSFALALALAGCGDNENGTANRTWAGTICTGADSLRVALGEAIGASDTARTLGSVEAMKKEISPSATKLQKAVEALDEAFSSTDILGTPLEIARNTMGKQLTQVFPLYDAVDAANSSLTSAKDVVAGAAAMSTLNGALAQGLPSVASLNVTVAGFKSSKDSVIKKAFASAPECKPIK